MPTPDPKVVDASTQGQRNLQPYVENFFMNLLKQPMKSPFGQALNQFSFESDTYNDLRPGLLDIFNQGRGPATSFFEAYEPIHQRNVQFGLGQLASAAPLANSSALATQGIDFATQEQQGFNLFAEQAQQNFLKSALEAAGMLGTLGQSAGSAVERRYINPITQLMGAAGNYANPRTEVYQPPGALDYFTQIAQAGAAAYSASQGRGG